MGVVTCPYRHPAVSRFRCSFDVCLWKGASPVCIRLEVCFYIQLCLRALVVRWLVKTERSKCESPGRRSVWLARPTFLSIS